MCVCGCGAIYQTFVCGMAKVLYILKISWKLVLTFQLFHLHFIIQYYGPKAFIVGDRLTFGPRWMPFARLIYPTEFKCLWYSGPVSVWPNSTMDRNSYLFFAVPTPNTHTHTHSETDADQITKHRHRHRKYKLKLFMQFPFVFAIELTIMASDNVHFYSMAATNWL